MPRPPQKTPSTPEPPEEPIKTTPPLQPLQIIKKGSRAAVPPNLQKLLQKSSRKNQPRKR